MEPAIQSPATRSELEQLLVDDVPHDDLTTYVLGIGARPGEMAFAACDAMVLAEAESAVALIELAGARAWLAARSGDRLEAGAAILLARGPAAALHRSWKVAQTLIETWSGVATAARAIVDAAQAVAPHIAVACTRKTAPGTKSFAVRAIRAGGATVHRLGLSETVLIFPEHRAFLGDETLAQTVARLRQATPETMLVIEVTSHAEALAAADAGFDVIQVEKFSPQKTGEVVAALKSRDLPSAKRPLVAAAGGITSENAADYARAGADVLVTSAPYRGRPRDVQVRIAPSQDLIVRDPD